MGLFKTLLRKEGPTKIKAAAGANATAYHNGRRASLDSDSSDDELKAPRPPVQPGEKPQQAQQAQQAPQQPALPRYLHLPPSVNGRRSAIDASAFVNMNGDGAPAPPAQDRRRSDVASSTLDANFSDVVLMHRGRNALIYRARERDSRRPVVLKSYDPRRGAAVDREVRVLRESGPHPGVVRLDRVLAADTGTHLVLEACSGGTLIEAIANSGGRLPEKVASRRIAGPLLRALAHLHSRGIVHRDIKPEHVLLAADGLRLADYSTAALLPWAQRKMRGSDCGASCNGEDGASRQRNAVVNGVVGGTAGAGVAGGALRCELLNHRLTNIAVEYAAPEVLSKPTAAEVFHLVISYGTSEEELPVYNEKADIWSVGALVFEALTGFQPFLADGAAELAAVIASRLAQRDEASGLPVFLSRLGGLTAEAKDFLARCMEGDPTARPGAAELLGHPWIARRFSTEQERSAPRNARASVDIGDGAGNWRASARGGGGAADINTTAPAFMRPAGAMRDLLASAFAAEGDSFALRGRGAATHANGNGAAPRAANGHHGIEEGDEEGEAGAALSAAPRARFSLQRSASVADSTAGPHLTTRSYTQRLEGAMPGRRAAAAARLAGNDDSDG